MSSKIIKQSSEDTNPEVYKFSGYTLEEMRYRRAMIAIQKDFCKEKILLSFQSFSKNTNIGKKSIFAGKSIFNKIFKSLDYMDYIMVGFSTLSVIRKISSIFRKKK